jgi:hypothetical protein
VGSAHLTRNHERRFRVALGRPEAPFFVAGSSGKTDSFRISGVSIISRRIFSDPDDYDACFRLAGRAGDEEAPNLSAQRGRPVVPILTTPGTSASVQDGRV